MVTLSSVRYRTTLKGSIFFWLHTLVKGLGFEKTETVILPRAFVSAVRNEVSHGSRPFTSCTCQVYVCLVDGETQETTSCFQTRKGVYSIIPERI